MLSGVNESAASETAPDVDAKSDEVPFDPSRPFTRKQALFNTPGNTLNRIHRQLVARRLPGVPRHLSPQWQLHFPGRG